MHIVSPSKCPQHDFVQGACIWCGLPKAPPAEIKIDDGVKVPKPNKTNRQEYREALFRDYCYWYKRVNIREPADMEVNAEGFITWTVAGQRQPGVNEKRLKELTTSLKRRIRHN